MLSNVVKTFHLLRASLIHTYFQFNSCKDLSILQKLWDKSFSTNSSSLFSLSPILDAFSSDGLGLEDKQSDSWQKPRKNYSWVNAQSMTPTIRDIFVLNEMLKLFLTIWFLQNLHEISNYSNILITVVNSIE